VINNNEDYRKLFSPNLMRKSCSGIDLSQIIINVDFSMKTVLGLWSSGDCGDKGFEKRVLRDDDHKTILYSVITVASPVPACMGPGPESLNLIAVPKIPVGYKVVFERIPD
jgi:hypothetical protein